MKWNKHLSIVSIIVCSITGLVAALGSSNNVITLTDDNFEAEIESAENTFVKFYAPWCGHCKNMAEDWDALGDGYASNPKIKIAKLDADKWTSVRDRYNIAGFPTLKWFGKGGSIDSPEEYNGGARDLQSLEEFVFSKTGQRAKLKAKPASFVTDLNADNFERTVLSNDDKIVFVEFFAPWCGHCKSLAPIWESVAKAFAIEEHVVVAKIDADKAENRPLASEYGVTGFPTLKLFKNGSNDPINYEGARTEEAIVQFLNEHAKTHRLPGGSLLPEAGRLEELDKLARKFMLASSEKWNDIKTEAETLARKANDKYAEYYIKVMSKIQKSKSVSYVATELDRLKGLISSSTNKMKGSQLDSFQIRSNILAAFTAAKDKLGSKLKSSVSGDESEDASILNKSWENEPEETAHKIHEAVKDKAGKYMHDASEFFDDATQKVKEKAGEYLDDASDGFEDAREATEDFVENTKESAAKIVDRIREEL